MPRLAWYPPRALRAAREPGCAFRQDGARALRKALIGANVTPVRTARPGGTVAPEIELVLLCSTPRLPAERVARLRSLLHERLDWYQVLGMLAAHRTMGVAWHTVLTHLIEERATTPSTYLLKVPEVVYRGQRSLAEEQNRHSAELLAALDARGVPCALLKGGAVARMAYPSLGMRVFNDNDVLVPHGCLGEAAEVLGGLGYGQGSWDYQAGRVRPAERAAVMLYPVSSHQTHPYLRPTPAAHMLDCHRVDLHFSVDLLTSNRTDDLVDDLLARRVDLGDSMWALDPLDMAVFSCIHFYKEATYLNEVARNKDLVLYKLVDLLALFGSEDYPVDLDALVDRAVTLGVADHVFHTLTHLDALFGAVPPAILDRLRPLAADGIIDEVYDDDGRVRRWSGPILDRFFDSRRYLDLVASTVPAAGGGGAAPVGAASRRRS